MDYYDLNHYHTYFYMDRYQFRYCLNYDHSKSYITKPFCLFIKCLKNTRTVQQIDYRSKYNIRNIQKYPCNKIADYLLKNKVFQELI